MSTTEALPVEGRIPSLDGATGWLNSAPLTESSLRGRPVLVEFWTFTCINWIRTLPYVRSWFENYQRNGLVVLGVHTPEFEVEREIAHVRRAAEQMGIGYPIALDSDYRIWTAFGNRYWPALYFIDADGQIRHHRFGEGDYEHSERVIQRLLAAGGAVDVGTRGVVRVDPSGVEAQADWRHLLSPETYVGYERAANFSSPGGASRGLSREYAVPDVLDLNQWALSGEWTVGHEAAVLNAPRGSIVHRFHARDLHLVMGFSADGQPVRFRVRLDGEVPGQAHGVDVDAQGAGEVTEPRLYQLIRQSPPVVERTFEITFLDRGARAYVFTFG
jgi:hypothetical protein